MDFLNCTDPNCPGLKRPVLPLGKRMAQHINLYHGGDEIVPVVDLDPTGEVGEAIIDRALKLQDDLAKLIGKKPPYKARFREPYYKMRAECVADVRAISIAAKEKACGNSSDSVGDAG